MCFLIKLNNRKHKSNSEKNVFEPIHELEKNLTNAENNLNEIVGRIESVAERVKKLNERLADPKKLKTNISG